MANRAANLLLLAEERAKKTALIFDDEHITFEQLAHYKVPAAVIIMPELPKGPTGKILRRELRPLARAAA